MSKLLTIQILGWNNAPELRHTLPALKNVPREHAIIRYIDNASHDNSVDVVTELVPDAEIIRLDRNSGFGGGHNAGIARTTTPYILTLNPDCEIVWSGIQRLLERMESDHSIGALQGKLLRNKDAASTIDSAGIMLSPALNGRERGAGEIDHGQYETPALLIATTGACSLYRVEALQQVKHSPTEFFDNDFFAYKEDVDLGWRLNRAGWKVLYEPVVVGYHSRSLRRTGRLGWGLSPGKIYRRLRERRTALSFRNWLWLMRKNASRSELVLHAPFILIRLVVFIILSVLYPPLFLAWREAGRGDGRMQHKGELRAAVK